MVHITAVRTSVFSKGAAKRVCQNGKHAPYCGFTAFAKHAKLLKFRISAIAPKTPPEGPNETSKCSEKSFCDPGGIWASSGSHFWEDFLSKITLSLRFPREICFSSALLVVKIRILAAISKGHLLFQRFAGTQNSHSRCDFQGKSSF